MSTYLHSYYFNFNELLSPPPGTTDGGVPVRPRHCPGSRIHPATRRHAAWHINACRTLRASRTDVHVVASILQHQLLMQKSNRSKCATCTGNAACSTALCSGKCLEEEKRQSTRAPRAVPPRHGRAQNALAIPPKKTVDVKHVHRN
jgi:hypothetical protein